MNLNTVRLDKWFWYARFIKSRTLATKLCNSGKVRVNGVLIKKAHQGIRIGDVLTFPLGSDIRVIKILQLGGRRGPAKEAQTLYEDLQPIDQLSKGEIKDIVNQKSVIADHLVQLRKKPY